MKNNYLFITLGVLCCSLASCGVKVPESVEFSLVNFDTTVEIHTNEQKAFLSSEDPDNYIKINKYDLATFSKSAPQAVTFSWNVTPTGSTSKPSKYRLNIESDNGNFVFETKNNTIDVYNLYVDTTYTWTVDAFYGKQAFTSNSSTFTIDAQAPRNCFADGVENLRDLGGWRLENGRTFLQGLIYRSAELNGGPDGLSKPTKNGKKTLVEQLGIKTEIDLRKTTASFDEDEVYGIKSSPLGSSVNYVSLPMEFGHTNILTNPKDKESVKGFFETLASRDNYPMVFHCVRGTDRTGALAYAIGAMCGMSEEDLMKDYLFSNFANINSNVIQASNINTTSFYVVGIRNATGDTLAEKAMNYIVNNVGVSKTTLENIVNILTTVKQ